ncbi:Cannabinoid receptor 1 [Frankliniella fusca]|uniref:Cannabinoid receptor 1 n=2 Tax=Frankliniella fusca TaxID=407009 RepID=A0AAE1HB07_9NEOP|nr:Cannabinoid receptor 1 [Frankliniella fusca]
MIVRENTDSFSTSELLSPQEELNKAAVKLLVDLRCTASLTGKAIERFERGAFSMIQQFSSGVRSTLYFKLTEKGLTEDEIKEVLSSIDSIEDPFKNLRTIEDQLNYFADTCGLIKPQQKYLDSRIDQRLNAASNSYVQTQVIESFQYVSVLGTLKSLLSNKKVRNRIFKDRVSKDGVLRSFVDGARFRDHPFLLKHKNVVQILLFYDELEIANSLGSKTIIHKLGVFLFQILNLPPEFSSALSSIHLLALAHADDLKRPGAFKKVLTPFVQEMKKLSSDYGLTFDEHDFVLRAVLAALTADTAAAHDLLGFLGPSAKYFCRKCMVTRAEIRANANATGVSRTKEMHQQHVEEVLENPRKASSSGVKRDSPLDNVPFFSSVENCVFDAFHDLLEGIAPLVLKLVLRQYIVKQKLFSVVDLNQRTASFSYGLPDAKNKPSPNFTMEMFTSVKTKLKQTGSQMWCLIRAFPFLIGDLVAEGDPFMRQVFLLQDVMHIVFSFEVTEDDLQELESLIFCHNSSFQELFIVEEHPNVRGENEDENVDEPDDELFVTVVEQDETTQEQAVSQKPFKVHVINKLHHLKHYPDMIREFGPLVRMWCAKFEGRMKIFRQHSAICCNFKNPPKTMADMFQLSNMNSFFSSGEERDIEFQKGKTYCVSESEYFDELAAVNLPPNQMISSTNAAVLNGEEYRCGLFVCTSKHQFAIIHEVLVSNKELFLIVKPWQTIQKSPRYNSFQVIPSEDSNMCVVNVLNMSSFRCIAPWNVTHQSDIYLSLRTLVL